MNFYAKFAKYSIISISAIFVFCVFFIVFYKISGMHENPYSKFSLITAFILFFPLKISWEYLLNNVDSEIKDKKFVEEPSLYKEIEGILGCFHGKVTVGIYPSNEVNAFAISSPTGKKTIIGFSTELLHVATKEEFLGIAAHEVAHILNGDSINKSFILSFGRLISFYPMLISHVSKLLLPRVISLFSALSLLIFGAVAIFGGLAKGIHAGIKLILLSAGYVWPLVLAIALAYALDYLLGVAFFSYSRGREYVADADAASLTSPDTVKAGLSILFDPRNKIDVFDSHPSLNERVRRLDCIS